MSRSYLLCATPRTGSTLLCSLLASTSVLGRPESYFREPDEAAWAKGFGLSMDGPRVFDYAAFVTAVRRVGTTANGVFAARVMWGSLQRILDGLVKRPGESDVETLGRTFGRLTFVHLRRADTIAQAVSWCRAEQTGFWQDGDTSVGSPTFDVNQLKYFMATIGEHNAGWQRWFAHQQIQPLAITYEELVQDPRSTVGQIADLLRVRIPDRWRPDPPQRKQADELNAEWTTALRSALGV
jgi:LPS sulfotransferase NodH